MMDDELGYLLDTRYKSLLACQHKFVTAHAPELTRQQASETVELLDAEIQNILHTVELLAAGEDALPHLQLLSLMVELETYLSLRGLWKIKLDWAAALLEPSAQIAPHLTHILFNVIGTAYSEMGNYEKAVELYTMAIHYSDLADHPDLTRVYGNLGVAYWRLGRLDEALVYTRRVWETEKAAGNRYETAKALANLAELHLEMGDPEGGMLAAYDALKLAHELGNSVLEAEMMALSAKHMMMNGLRHEALPVYEMAIRLLEQAGNEPALGLTQLNFGVLQHLLRNPQAARKLVQAARRIFEQYGMADELDTAQAVLAQLAAG